ncbi:hypothetical protein PVAG01_01257 [Phlyctema vagabunda]|uniref:Uncharacterized protein n=1 Tax=Phlyctema vagabunda TaxID=108571 RepID=A0ABR4PX24_9HELO
MGTVVPARAFAAKPATSVEQAAKRLLELALLQTISQPMEPAGRTGRRARARHLAIAARARDSVAQQTRSADPAVKLLRALVVLPTVSRPMVHAGRTGRRVKGPRSGTAAQALASAEKPMPSARRVARPPSGPAPAARAPSRPTESAGARTARRASARPLERAARVQGSVEVLLRPIVV